MFTTFAQSNLKQPVTFIASLCLQSLVLVILCAIPIPQRFGPSMGAGTTRSTSVTPIYFVKDAIAPPSIQEAAPAESHLAAEPPSEAKSDTAVEANTQAEAAGNSSGMGEEQGLAPFPNWRMNSVPTGFSVMHHQVKTALPVFTPDPPILRGEVPEPARGKDIVMNVVIDERGSIVQVEVLQGIGYGLENSIVETLRRWIFVPAKINGVAVASQRQLHFHFPG
jgi:TonB family protein